MRRLAGWAVGGLAAVAATFMLAQAVVEDSELSDELAAFQHRVTGGATPASDESPAAVLARRYLRALDPEMRRRITDQVRDEQRTGITAPGRSAFVLRRLELYEAALRRSAAGPTGPVPLPERGEPGGAPPPGGSR